MLQRSRNQSLLLLLVARWCCYPQAAQGWLPQTTPTKYPSPKTRLPAGALSIPMTELAELMGGMGRARLVWDCYRVGLDPSLYFRQSEASSSPFRSLFPSARRNQRLGEPALHLLDEINNGTSVEGGVASLCHVSVSEDGTIKLLLELRDGHKVETVIIPWEGTRSTLCISSQVGCRQGCTFCATGRMGKLRSLTSDEILAQMFFARKLCRERNIPPITNLVFMGMGEPADNADAVITATVQLTTRAMFQLSTSKVTVSTVAPTPEAFSAFASAPCVLAWSVHAANDTIRRQLVPTTRHAMVELREGLINALLQRPLKTTMLEVALMAGVNDSLQDADELATFVRVIADRVPGAKVMVNLIPYNPSAASPYRRPDFETVRAFQRRLWTAGVFTHVRSTRGDDESAACGQLATTGTRKVHARS